MLACHAIVVVVKYANDELNRYAEKWEPISKLGFVRYFFGKSIRFVSMTEGVYFFGLLIDKNKSANFGYVMLLFFISISMVLVSWFLNEKRYKERGKIL